MPAAIYYFSATGNSFVVAKDLAQELGGAKLIPIPQAFKDNSEQPYDLVGIVYPVYMFGLPLIIANFLKKIKLKPDTYIFSVATLGGLPGRAHTLIREILKNRGFELAAGFSVRMPGNYTPLYEAIPKEKQEEMFKAEKERVKFISGCVSAKKQAIIEEKPFLLNFLLYILLYHGGISLVPLSGKNFWSTQACTKCGICVKICPVENITLVEGKPKWLKHCQQCMACLQWCPVEAIQYKKSTLGRKRYHHPAVSAQDIIRQKQ
ncbi:MAG: EFR1 family ferrodoxin [Candidatus Omnitrophica bacterium]|jgi:ferredoxin/flavodoxin|nr:EFR1 family ferrodoxin [Candidatus Omnitrophota bacterium]